MRSCKLFLVVTASLLGLTASAGAEEWTPSFSSAFHSGYMFPKTGFVAWDGPVIQSDFALSKGSWSLDVWNSTELSTVGTYGKRGGGDEFDFTATYSHDLDSFLGPLSFQSSASYWMVDRFGYMKDDIVQLYAHVGRPFTFDALTVTPYVRLTEWVSMGSVANTSFVDTGVAFSIPLDKQWRLDLDASYSTDVTNHIGIKNATPSVSYEASPGLSISASAQFADRMQPSFGIGVTLSGDALNNLF
jgi:hypothetical protein